MSLASGETPSSSAEAPASGANRSEANRSQANRSEAARERALEERFEELIVRSRHRARELPFPELRELARLYRIHSARLALLRTRGRDSDAIRYLNGLCVQAYAMVYADAEARAPRTPVGSQILDTLGATWRAQLLTTALLAVGVLIGMAVSYDDARVRTGLVPFYSASRLERLAESQAERDAFLARGATPVAQNAIFGSQLFFHNTRVGLMCFVVGILAGVPTLILIGYNGLTLGAFASIFTGERDLLLFLAWIIPHAIPELLAVILCSTGGLLMGSALLSPGRLPYRRALERQARHALRLFGLAVPLFGVAALIESFVRESALSTGTRFAVATAVSAAIASYVLLLAFAARRRHALDLSWLATEAAALRSDPPRES